MATNKSIIFLLLISIPGLLAQKNLREVPGFEEELKFPAYRPAISKSSVQFTIKWLYKQHNRPIPDSLDQSDAGIIGNLYSRFSRTKLLALEPQKSSDLNRMKFPVFGKAENLVHSEVRFYREFAKTDKFYRRAMNFTVYKVRGNQFHDHLEYVNSTILPAFKSGWFSVDITDCYKSWMSSGKNQGIQVVTEFAWNRKSRVRPELTGIVDFQALKPNKWAFLVNFYG